LFIGGMAAGLGELRPDQLGQLRGGGHRFAKRQDDRGERGEAHRLPALLPSATSLAVGGSAAPEAV
jgi:hypothetical protein